MERLGIIDLCSGMGGLSYAAREVGLEVWAGVDTSISAICSFRHNFPMASPIPGDISDQRVIGQIAEEIQAAGMEKERLIVVSGPPCKGFSDAGPRKVGDPRNEVLISVAKAIVDLGPAAAIIENVSALQKTRNAKVLRRFKAVLNSSGYHVYSFELNSLDFGVPQKRRRMIYYVLPFSIKKKCISQKLKTFHRSASTVREILGHLPIPPERPFNYDPIDDNGTLANHYAMRHSQRVKNKIANIKPGTGPLSYRKLKPDSYAATLLSGHRAPPVHYEQPRSITVREALLLQSFPDSFQVMGPFGNQMEQVTNAVPALLGKATIHVLMQLLGENNE